MKKLRVSSGLNLHSYPQTDIIAYIREGLLFNKRAGFDAADFSMRYIQQMGEAWEAGIERVKADMEEIGIRAEVCHLPFGVVDGTPEELAAFDASVHKAIDAAKRLDVPYAVVHPNTTTIPRLQFDRKEYYDKVMSHLAPFVEHGNKVGVNIVVENMRPVPQNVPFHRYCAEPDELCEIADGLGIGVCWDFGHANIAGLKQSEAIGYVGSRLKVLHVNDNFAWEDEHIPPFMGRVDWADAMQGLRTVDFEGLLNYEIATARIPERARESFARYLMDTAAQLCELI